MPQFVGRVQKAVEERQFVSHKVKSSSEQAFKQSCTDSRAGVEHYLLSALRLPRQHLWSTVHRLVCDRSDLEDVAL